MAAGLCRTQKSWKTESPTRSCSFNQLRKSTWAPKITLSTVGRVTSCHALKSQVSVRPQQLEHPVNLLGLSQKSSGHFRPFQAYMQKPVLLGSCKHQTKTDSMYLCAGQAAPVQWSQNLPLSRQEFWRCNRLRLQDLHFGTSEWWCKKFTLKILEFSQLKQLRIEQGSGYVSHGIGLNIRFSSFQR